MAPIVLLRLFRADCDFNQDRPHPADPIKCRTSTQRTQAPESVDTPRASALDPLENNIRLWPVPAPCIFTPFHEWDWVAVISRTVAVITGTATILP